MSETKYISDVNITKLAKNDIDGKKYSYSYCSFCGKPLLVDEKEVCNDCTAEINDMYRDWE